MNEKCTVHCIHVDLFYLFNFVIYNDMNNQIKIFPIFSLYSKFCKQYYGA